MVTVPGSPVSLSLRQPYLSPHMETAPESLLQPITHPPHQHTQTHMPSLKTHTHTYSHTSVCTHTHTSSHTHTWTVPCTHTHISSPYIQSTLGYGVSTTVNLPSFTLLPSLLSLSYSAQLFKRFFPGRTAGFSQQRPSLRKTQPQSDTLQRQQSFSWFGM